MSRFMDVIAGGTDTTGGVVSMQIILVSDKHYSPHQLDLANSLGRLLTQTECELASELFAIRERLGDLNLVAFPPHHFVSEYFRCAKRG
jgi:hypothetical protein